MPPGLDGGLRKIYPPAIDPLSPKNMALSPEDAAFVCEQFGIDTDRPLICQVSRFDPWKDPIGVIDAYRIVTERVPDAQLALVGSMATDDPEGWDFFHKTFRHADGDPDIKILNNLNNVGAIEVNAFQSQADVCMQKSIREGFGLTVTEAQWKGRPMIGGDVGGIPLQIDDGVSGFLVDSPAAAAERRSRSSRTPSWRSGSAGRQGARARALPHAAVAARLAPAVHGAGDLAQPHGADPAGDRLQPGPSRVPARARAGAAGAPRRRRAGDRAHRAGGATRRALGRLGDDRRGRRGRARGRRTRWTSRVDGTSYDVLMVEPSRWPTTASTT